MDAGEGGGGLSYRTQLMNCFQSIVEREFSRTHNCSGCIVNIIKRLANNRI